jgi:hypothetical protein
MKTRLIALWVASALALGGCSYIHVTSLSVTRADSAPSFTREEQDTARAIVTETCSAAGFWETDTAQTLSNSPSSWPYVWFVSFGAPGGRVEQRSVTISGEMRKDRREIRISVGDSARGEPLPATRQLIEELRASLERAFPDSRVDVTFRRTPHVLAP